MAGQIAIFFVGLFSGFVGAMTGIGGALLAVPLLLFLSSFLSLPSLTVHAVTGLAMVQGLTTNLAGMWRHHQAGFVSPFLLRWAGTGMVGGTLLGSVLSRWVPAQWLLKLLSLVLLFCAFQMLRPVGEQAEGESAFVPFKPYRFLAAGFIAGFLSGLTGLGAASLVMVLLIHWLQVPVRLAVGSTMGISLVAALVGTFGKAVTWQVPFAEAVVLSIGAASGAIGGAQVSHRLPAPFLRRLLALVIAFAAFHALWRAFR